MKSVVLVLAICCSCRLTDPVGDSQLLDRVPVKGPKPEILDGSRLDHAELSGVAARKSPNNGRTTELIMVGDANLKVTLLKVSRQSPAASGQNTLSLSSLFTNREKPHGSQWEAIASDSTGRFFALDEQDATVDIIAPDGTTLLKRLQLESGRGSSSPNGENSGPESMILTANGHLFVIYEKDTSRLAEFGPAGSQPEGLKASILLGENDEWPLPQDSEFKLLQSWELDSAFSAIASDISDAAVGPGKKVFLLSDESRRIYRLEGNIQTSESKISARHYWNLPDGISKPEGLTFIGETPVIVSDVSGGEKNIFFLEPLQEGAP